MDKNNVPLTSHTTDDLDWPDRDENNSSGPSSSLELPQPQASSNSSLVPSFQLPVSTGQHPIIPHLNMNHTTRQGPTISLNSPEPDDGVRKYPLPSTISSGNTRTIVSQDQQIDFSSDDSDASTSRMMKSLTVHSCKASGAHHSGHTTSSDQDSDPLPTTSNRSVSHKRPRDMAAEFNTKLNNASDSLMRHIQDSTTAKVEHKRLKIESKLASIELKARLSRDEREHVLRSTSAAQSHERAMADEWTRQLELEIKLEQVKLECLALEKEMSRQGN
jgi:hypothetical protein